MKALPKWIITLIVFVVLSLVTGCGGHSVSTQPPANSTLRFVQTNATAGVVDVFVDNTLLRGSVPYLSDTGYLPLPAGAHQFSVQTVGASVPFVSSQITLAAGSANSFILSGWGPFEKIGMVVTDDTASPPAGNIRLRVSYMALQSTATDVFILPAPNVPSGTPTFHLPVIPMTSDYFSLPAGTYHIFVTQAGATTILFDSGPLTFTAGQNRTVAVFSDCQPTSCGLNTFRTLTLPDLN